MVGYAGLEGLILSLVFAKYLTMESTDAPLADFSTSIKIVVELSLKMSI